MKGKTGRFENARAPPGEVSARASPRGNPPLEVGSWASKKFHSGVSYARMALSQNQPTTGTTGMEQAQSIKKPRRKQDFSLDMRNKLEGLVDEYRRLHGNKSFRFPTEFWAELLGVSSSCVRRELNRGKSVQGPPEAAYFVYSAHKAQLDYEAKQAKKGAPSKLEQHKDDPLWQAAFRRVQAPPAPSRR